MNAAPKSQIVHESDTQRQHVRLPFPVRAEISGVSYETKDLSSGGVSVKGVEKNYPAGTVLALSLKFPFEHFGLDVTLEAEVQHSNTRDKILGCRFVNLAPDQISLLNHVLKAFLAGDVVAAGDLLNVAKRDNFVKLRKQPTLAAPLDWKKQAAALGAVAILGLAAVFLILGNIYETFFFVKSSDAFVSGPIVEARAASGGYYKSQIGPEAITVQPGEKIGSVTPNPGGQQPQLETAVLSPCDCFIADIHKQPGEYVTPGEALVSLVPADAALWVIAEIDPQQAARIGLNDQAKVMIAGSKIEYSGRVTAIKSGISDSENAISSESGFLPHPVRVKIELQGKIPVDLVGRPAHATFIVH